MIFPEPAPAGDGPARVDAPASAARRFFAIFAVPSHDRRFWVVQALVLVIAAGHLTLELGGALLGWPQFYLVPISTFFIPAMYASLVFGQRGAIPTVLWCWALSLPGIIFFHTPTERVGVSLQLAIMLTMAILVGRKVDRERRANAETVAVNAQLRELNATAGTACRSLDLEQVFSDTLQVIVLQQPVAVAWIVYAPANRESRTVMECSDARPSARELPELRRAATRRVIERGEPYASADGADPASSAPQAMVIVPVRAGDTVVGGLGVAGPKEVMRTHGVDQLGAVARQLGLAVDNSTHFETAQSALLELAGSQAALEQYVQLATDAREEERKRLARELHDETIQMLVVARGSLEAACGQPVSVAGQVADTIATLDSAIAELRRVCRDLRPSILDDLGLLQALEALTVELAGRTGMQVSMTCDCDEHRLEARTEVVLYRIAQEALHNTERHSGAGHAKVSLIARPDAVALRVADDGCGFRPPDRGADPAETGHLGLLGMQERAKSLGGVLTIESSPGAGTLVEVRAPGK